MFILTDIRVENLFMQDMHNESVESLYHMKHYVAR